ncbi:hypothetical protein AAFF_G00378840 [Aldrovandia affinis]|uniref:Fibronectin type-III domain-containing protein n=1 Tax=Aldrovandia affinis TaxID=143900 RepID=A0AAD7SFD8_9TELE|nr:hypothetical protein AAFF_G00378840 [Aldrovandia affinis]
MDHCLLWALLLTSQVRVSQCQNGFQPPVPQRVRVEPDFVSQVLSIAWDKDLTYPVLFYDIEVLRTELGEIVYNYTIEVRADSAGRFHHWNWTSPIPLECTSHTVRVRSRQQQHTSDWSEQIVPGMDIPVNTGAKMYPQDRVVAVGSNTTFCCIVQERKEFKSFKYKTSILNSTRLSRRSYAGTVTNQPPSIPSGTNVVCLDDSNYYTGTVVFVGYPPGDRDLVCETRDLVSVECQWRIGQDTYLRGVQRQTHYTLNGKQCKLHNNLVKSSKKDKLQCQLSVTLDQGEINWTLGARNPLGTIQLTDKADINHRVRPHAPLEVYTANVYSRNASVHWRWGPNGYRTLPLECQAHVNSSENTYTFDYSGPGVSEALLKDLQPDEEYTVRIRCRTQQNTWKWGDWSLDYNFQTIKERPDALNIWVWMDSNQTGYVKWKPLSKSESHGQIVAYEVTYWNPEEDGRRTLSLPQTQHRAPLCPGDIGDCVITVTARNSAGTSPAASITIPRFSAGEVHTLYKVSGRNGGFDLFWPPYANTSCGYVVEWCPTGKQDCDVDWRKVPAGNASARIESGSFVAGVRYTFSIYACSSGAPELLERRQGYVVELAPAQHVSELKAQQYGSDVLLSWDEVPLDGRRGFICGYTVYTPNGSHLVPIENITDPNTRSYMVRHLSPGFYKFTVKAHTSGGQDGGVTVSLKLDPSTDWLVIEILVALGAMTGFLFLITIFCYTKRQWVKKTFYPEIPEPKLPEEWPTTPGTFGSRTLAVEPCPHNTVHIVENPERESDKFSPEVELEEEEGDGAGAGESPPDTDSSDPVVLRYYNQVVDDGSQGPRSADSSSSSSSDSSSTSLASTRTDVTYTGIQSAASSSGAPVQPEASDMGGYRPQMTPELASAEPQADSAGPADFPLLGDFGGYQPQITWRADSRPASTAPWAAPHPSAPPSSSSPTPPLRRAQIAYPPPPGFTTCCRANPDPPPSRRHHAVSFFGGDTGLFQLISVFNP